MQSSASASVTFHIVNNRGVVTLKQRLHEKASRADYTHTDENPQEETINHHSHIFPVFNDLQRGGEMLINPAPVLFTVLSYSETADNTTAVSISCKIVQFHNF